MAVVTVKIDGLKELEKKLDGKFLVQPEIEPALDSGANRAMRGGKGIGAQRNTISVAAQPLSRTIASTLNAPRVKGTSWRMSNLRRFLPPVIRNALNKAARNIRVRWAS